MTHGLPTSSGAASVELLAPLRLTVPILDGAAVRATYGVDTYPKFFVVDTEGLLTWQFNGFGAETGYLVKRELEKLAK